MAEEDVTEPTEVKEIVPRSPLEGVFQHFRNKRLYRILCEAQDHETLDIIVVYQGLHDGRIWARELENFLEEKPNELNVLVPRFRYSEVKV